MKIKMGISPRNPEQAEKRYWPVTIIRAFGVLQIIGGSLASFFFLQPSLTVLMRQMGLYYDTASAIAVPLSLFIGVIIGLCMAAMTFAIAAAFDDLHAIRGYLRDLTITGQYYDE